MQWNPPDVAAMIVLLAMTPSSRRRFLVPLLIGIAVAAVFNLGLLASAPSANDPGAAQILKWLRLPAVTIVANAAVGILIIWSIFGILFGGSRVDRLVRSLKRRGDFEGAAEIYLQHGHLGPALANFKRGKAWPKAADVAARLKRDNEAGELYRLAGGRHLGDAARAFRQADNSAAAQKRERDLAKWLVQDGHINEAIEAWIRGGEPKLALKTANLALKEGRLLPADTAFRAILRVAEQLSDHPTIARLNEALGEWKAAGFAWRTAGEHDRAVQAFLKADIHTEAARSEVDSGHPHEAAAIRVRHLKHLNQRMQQAGHPRVGPSAEVDRLNAQIQAEVDALLPVLSDLGMEDELIQVLTSSGQVEKAADILVASGRTEAAADLTRNAQQWTLAAPLLESLNRWSEAGDLWEFAGNIEEAARCAERAGEDARALELYRSLGRADKTAKFMARLGHLQDALIELHRAELLGEAFTVLRENPGPVPDIPDVVIDIAQWARANGSLDDAIFCLQRAVVGVAMQPGRLEPAVALARFLHEAGDTEKATAIVDRILEFDFSCEPAHELRDEIVAAERAGVQTVPATGAGHEVFSPTSGPHRYEILTELGRGGMGVVYKARDTRLERDVAIKVLRATSAEVAAKLEEEAKTAATLNHPGIVTIFDFEAGFGGYFIAMEYVPGEALDQVIRTKRSEVSTNLVLILTRLAEAVAYAHVHRIIHRDLKPANILLTPEYDVKVLDFGIAARLDLTTGGDLRLYGTPYYMAPEQIRRRPPTPATDVYSFGATAFHLATGRPPFDKGNIVDAHLHEDPPDPLALEPGLDHHLAGLILRCLEKQPATRFADGTELYRALRSLKS
jgi:tetratricopeptide (TPR) repeat protein